MKKILSLCLSLLLAAALLSPVASLTAFAAGRTPVINIEGEREIEVWKEDGTHYSPTQDPADAVVDEAIKELVPVFIKALLTNHYDEWSRKALEKLTPIYDEIRPNPDGSLPENTHPYFPPYGYGGATEVQAPEQVNDYYTYDWDFRRSPLDEADALDAQTAGMTLDAVNVCVDSAIDALSVLTGEKATKSVVEEIFAKFCVGK